jgi:hypothetical protein
MSWRVLPSLGGAGTGRLRSLWGPFDALECRWHISRWAVSFGGTSLAVLNWSGCGHVTRSVFDTRVSGRGGVGAGVELGVRGRAGGP